MLGPASNRQYPYEDDERQAQLLLVTPNGYAALTNKGTAVPSYLPPTDLACPQVPSDVATVGCAGDTVPEALSWLEPSKTSKAEPPFWGLELIQKGGSPEER